MAAWSILPTLSNIPESGAGPIKCAASVISQAVNRAHLASSYPSLGSIVDLRASAAVPMAEAMDIVRIFVSRPLYTTAYKGADVLHSLY